MSTPDTNKISRSTRREAWIRRLSPASALLLGIPLTDPVASPDSPPAPPSTFTSRSTQVLQSFLVGCVAGAVLAIAVGRLPLFVIEALLLAWRWKYVRRTPRAMFQVLGVVYAIAFVGRFLGS